MLGIYTTEGITKLCEGLKGSAVTSLRCAAAPSVNFPSTPVDACSLSPYPHLVPILRSLGFNSIGSQGAAKLAAVLSQTQITNLECAAPRTGPKCLLSCQRPLTHLRTLLLLSLHVPIESKHIYLGPFQSTFLP